MRKSHNPSYEANAGMRLLLIQSIICFFVTSMPGMNAIAKPNVTEEVNPLQNCGVGTDVPCGPSNAVPFNRSLDAFMAATPTLSEEPAEGISSNGQDAAPPRPAPKAMASSPIALPSPLDSGLLDCGTPAKKLLANCKDGNMCVHVAPSQFPEVVYLIRHASNTDESYCSGTVIAPSWILTAAHCIIGNKPTTSFVKTTGSDYAFPQASSIEIRADNAFSLPASDRVRRSDRTIVFAKFTGDNLANPYDGDLALVHFSPPFPVENIPPDGLAKQGSFTVDSASAGFGYANGTLGVTRGTFSVSWPPKLTDPPPGNFLEFSMIGDTSTRTNGAFCSGDSGGPVFVGRARGCKLNDRPEPEARPRTVEGINISNEIGTFSSDDSVAKQWIESCLSSRLMKIGSVMLPQRHDWICKTTSDLPFGCQ